MENDIIIFDDILFIRINNIILKIGGVYHENYNKRGGKKRFY